MSEFIKKMASTLANGEDIVVVTLLSKHGSVPQSAGAKMLVSKEGQLMGTIGGGAIEFQSEQKALEILETKQNDFKNFVLAPNKIADIGMICGGQAEVLYQFIAADDHEMQSILAIAKDKISKNQPCYFITPLSEEMGYPLGFYTEETKTVHLPRECFIRQLPEKTTYFEEGDVTYYAELLITLEKVYLFGGGHVAQAVAPLLKALDFRVTVFDDRSEYLTEDLFPVADERIMGNFNDLTNIQLTKYDYACILTRSHALDLLVEEHLLQMEPAYIGVMGSKHKVATHMAKLQESGFSKEDLSRLKAPIGIAIKAYTPIELAVSIAAELIQVRAEKK